jgi:hypothetical protein
MIVCDVLTAAFIREAPTITLDSYNQTMKRNADGSIDICFKPMAPAGKAANWIYTTSNCPFFPAMRFYGPEKPLFDKTLKLLQCERPLLAGHLIGLTGRCWPTAARCRRTELERRVATPNGRW